MDNYIKKLATFLADKRIDLGDQKEIRVWGYHEAWCEKVKGSPECTCDPAIFFYHEAAGAFHVLPGAPPEGEVNAVIKEKGLEIRAEMEAKKLKKPSRRKPTKERVVTRRPKTERGDIFIDNIGGKTIAHRGRKEDIERIKAMFPDADLNRGYWIILNEGEE